MEDLLKTISYFYRDGIPSNGAPKEFYPIIGSSSNSLDPECYFLALNTPGKKVSWDFIEEQLTLKDWYTPYSMYMREKKGDTVYFSRLTLESFKRFKMKEEDVPKIHAFLCRNLFNYDTTVFDATQITLPNRIDSLVEETYKDLDPRFQEILKEKEKYLVTREQSLKNVEERQRKREQKDKERVTKITI